MEPYPYAVYVPFTFITSDQNDIMHNWHQAVKWALNTNEHSLKAWAQS